MSVSVGFKFDVKKVCLYLEDDELGFNMMGVEVRLVFFFLWKKILLVLF